MANSSLNLVNLDFTAYKNSLKQYFKNNDQFKDIDFEGSNISMLLDILAYNTYHNAFYLNMVGSEMFMDTALLRDSIYSHAKELNYIPRSARSAQAQINILVTPTVFRDSLTVSAGTTFSSKFGTKTLSFVLPESIALTSRTNESNPDLLEFYANNVTIYEGFAVTDTFVMNDTDQSQRFVLSNPNTDTTSIKVNVVEDSTSQITQYRQLSSFLNVRETDPVFFVQGAENGQYEIVFGNNVTGRRPKKGAVINCEYRVSSGSLSNGASAFSLDGDIQGLTTEVAITSVRAAENGAGVESINSIKFNAPRYYQTQERAVTSRDYQTLLKSQFPEIDSIHVYGGEEADPPQYGKVIIAVDIFDAEGAPAYNVENYKKYLKEKTPLTIDPVFVNPSFVYCLVDSRIVYNLNTSTASSSDIKVGVKSTINTFCQENINDFDVTLRYSKLTAAIDKTYSSIVSNETTITLLKYLVPTNKQMLLRENIATKVYFFNPISSFVTDSFTYFFQGSTYRNAYAEDDRNGVVNLVLSGKLIPIGSVDYEQGIVTFDSLVVASYSGEGVGIRATPSRQDITVRRNEILQTRESDINVTVVGEYL